MTNPFKLKNALIGAGLLALVPAAQLSAQTVTISTATGVTPGSNAVITVSYAPGAGGSQAVGGIDVRFSFARPPGVASGTVGATPGTATCGGSATNTATGTQLTVARASVTALGAETLCTFTIPTAAAASGNNPFTINFTEYADPGGNVISNVNTVNGGINFAGGGGSPVAPTVTFNPVPGAVSFPTGAVGATVNTSIAVTSAGGANGGSVTVNNCALSGAAGTATISITNSPINLTGTAGGAQINGSVNLQCANVGAANSTATLTCVETPTNPAGAAVNRVFNLTCPAGTATTPPTLTYAPNFGSTINVPAGAGAQNTTIQVGCPTDGAACAGSGTGLAATARLEQIGITGFSPASLACQFVNEAGTVIGAGTGPLDFVAATADPGDLRCTCTNALSPQNYILTVQERIPANAANTVGRQWNVTCGAGGNCGTVSATPNSGTVNLNNGGAAVQVASATVAGITAGLSQTVSCTTSAAPAGSTFTVTTAPSPLTLSTGTTTGTVSATCTNTNTTAATVTLTCNTLCSAAGSTATQISQYTLSCPGQAGPPPTQNALPVPFASDAGKVLLAGLVMLLGLAVVGFRSRG